jgi:hypothetical protein
MPDYTVVAQSSNRTGKLHFGRLHFEKCTRTTRRELSCSVPPGRPIGSSLLELPTNNEPIYGAAFALTFRAAVTVNRRPSFYCAAAQLSCARRAFGVLKVATPAARNSFYNLQKACRRLVRLSGI